MKLESGERVTGDVTYVDGDVEHFEQIEDYAFTEGMLVLDLGDRRAVSISITQVKRLEMRVEGKE